MIEIFWLTPHITDSCDGLKYRIYHYLQLSRVIKIFYHPEVYLIVYNNTFHLWPISGAMLIAKST